MSELINVTICVSDIPRDKIKLVESGKKYMNIVIASRRETDQYGHTHTVYMSQSKEEREAKKDKVYIGSGKAYQPTGAATSESVDSAPAVPADKVGDLPF